LVVTFQYAPLHALHASKRAAARVNHNQRQGTFMTFRQSANIPARHVGSANFFPAAPINPDQFTRSQYAGERLLRLPELVRTIGVSRATIYRYINSGRLPPPVKLSTRSIAWRASEITAWMAALQNA
jgi:prophage regulatory protein